MANKNNCEKMSTNFIPKEFNKNQKDPHFYRNRKYDLSKHRNLTAEEIEVLAKNNNFAEDWNEIFVAKEFNPNLIKNCEFFGRVIIGKLSHGFLEYNDLKLPIGLSNSTIISCEIGDNVAIRDVHYLSHYIINKKCILFNIHEMTTTNHAKFGNGIIKEGESEDLRVWLEICNENEGRKVLPFESMIPADAYIWSKFRDDQKLMELLIKITDNILDKKRGYYGEVGTRSVVKNSRIIKDVKVGEHAYIKGSNKLKNLTILSSKEEPSQVGEGVELVNGIVGYGCKIFYGSRGVRFLTGRNTQLKYGARLINSVLGDNSTVSCCEILNNLIFPFHEQHHNTSFLIAATILGQSNIAAGATIGSNHNSRAPDGEIVAGRGFWPGLCTNFKHNSKFASFVLIAKGSYNYELNIKYPFSLLSTNLKEEEINIVPAYWFVYNMYAVARNTYKFQKRDKRIIKTQNIEFEYLAPDTVSEILKAISRIEYLVGKKINDSAKNNSSYEELISAGKKYLKNNDAQEIEINDPEAMKRYGAKILKPIQGIKEYKKMCLYFFLYNIINYFKFNGKSSFEDFENKIKTLYKKTVSFNWWNIGGQIMPEEGLDKLKDDIKKRIILDWESIHKRYDLLWEKYPEQKTRYALYALEQTIEKNLKDMQKKDWEKVFIQGIDIIQNVLNLSISSREKDFSDPFRKMIYSNEKEMNSVLKSIDDNPFLDELKNQTNFFIRVLKSILSTM